MNSRHLAWVHVVYGCAAVLVGGLGGIAAMLDAQTARGCSGMIIVLYAILLIALAALGIPQVWIGALYLRGRPGGATALRWLSVANLLVNLGTAALFVAGDTAVAGLVLLPAFAVNIATLVTLARERRATA